MVLCCAVAGCDRCRCAVWVCCAYATWASQLWLGHIDASHHWMDHNPSETSNVMFCAVLCGWVCAVLHFVDVLCLCHVSVSPGADPNHLERCGSLQVVIGAVLCCAVSCSLVSCCAGQCWIVQRICRICEPKSTGLRVLCCVVLCCGRQCWWWMRCWYAPLGQTTCGWACRQTCCVMFDLNCYA